MPLTGLTSRLNNGPSSLSMEDLNESITAITCGSVQNPALAGAGVDVEMGVLPTGNGVGDSVEMKVGVAVIRGREVNVGGGSGVKDGSTEALGGAAGVGRQALNNMKHKKKTGLNFIFTPHSTPNHTPLGVCAAKFTLRI